MVYCHKTKNISIEILKDIGMVMTKIMETRFNTYMHAQAGNNNNMHMRGLCMLLLLPSCTCIYMYVQLYYNLVSMIFVITIPISFNISMEMF